MTPDSMVDSALRARRGRLTWVGHATARIDLDGFRVLTDPMLRRRAAHLRRRCRVPDPSVADVDLVVISHVHMDHLHLPSLALVPRSVPVIVPRGARSLLRRAGFDTVIDVVAGERTELHEGVAVETVHAEHRPGRGPHSRIDARPVGHVIEVAGHRTYFAGDTDLFDEMAVVHDVDVALLPIWGWGPSIGPGHLDPVRAAAATEMIDPEVVVPIHWGTYAPEDLRRIPAWFRDPVEQFARELDERSLGDRLRLLEPGDAVTIAGRAAA